MKLLILLLFVSLSFGAEFIVKLRPGADPRALEGYRVIKRFKSYALVEIPQDRVSGMVALNSSFEYVARNVRLRAFAIPNDPMYVDQWGMSLVNAELAWDVNVDCSPIIVAVIDTGVDYWHEDLRDNVWRNEIECMGSPNVDDDGNGFVDDCYGWDFVNSDPDPIDDQGHGTHVAGIVGAVGNNSTGVAGVCWKARIMAVKILGSNGTGSAYDFLSAVHYAVDNGARVINTSLGTDDCNISEASLQPLRDAVEYANSKGIVIVAAAGNSGSDNDTCPVYPASFSKDYPNVISVASVDGDGKLSSFSNYGLNTVDLAAPGGFSGSKSILSTYAGNSYTYIAGTSIASPFVAGAVAHILSSDPSLTPSLVKNRLLSSVQIDSSLVDKVRSGGYLDLLAALSSTISSGGSASQGSNAEASASGGGGCNSVGGIGSSIVLAVIFLILRRLLPKLSQ